MGHFGYEKLTLMGNLEGDYFCQVFCDCMCKTEVILKSIIDPDEDIGKDCWAWMG